MQRLLDLYFATEFFNSDGDVATRLIVKLRRN